MNGASFRVWTMVTVGNYLTEKKHKRWEIKKSARKGEGDQHGMCDFSGNQ